MKATINGIPVEMSVDEFIEYQRKVSGVKAPVLSQCPTTIFPQDIRWDRTDWNPTLYPSVTSVTG